MNTEPKPRLTKLTEDQFTELMARHDDVAVPHIYLGPLGGHWVRADEWRAFQAISEGQQT